MDFSGHHSCIITREGTHVGAFPFFITIMRQRFNTAAISRTTPEGRSIVGRKEILRKKFLKDDITDGELRSYSLILWSHKRRNNLRTITVFGTKMQVTLEEYNKYCRGMK